MSRPSATRVVRYGYHVPDGAYSRPDAFDEVAMERLLAGARAAGVVTQYDTGRGAVVWFEGAPGAALRELRERARALFRIEPTPLR